MKLRSQFLRNASTLTFGTLVAQLFNIVIYPILGRIYTPQDFALLANVTSICSILSIIGAGKYEMSVLLCKDEKEATNMFVLCMFISLLSLTFFGVILFFTRENLTILLKEPKLSSFIFISVITSFAIIIFNCYNEWCVRTKEFRSLAINKINNSGAVAIGKLLFGYPYKVINGLVWGDCLGRIISAFGCIYRLLKIQPKFFRMIEKGELYRLAKRYANFPLYILPGQLLNSLSTAVPVFLISYYYTSEVTGYYSMALSLLLLPVNVISNAIKDVFRQKIVVELREGRNCRLLVIRLLIPLTIICVALGLIIYPLLPKLFSFFVGEKWVESGIYCQLLLVMAIFDFLAMSINGVLLAAEQLKVIFIWQVVFLILTLAPIIISGEVGKNAYDMLLLFSICRSIGYVLFIILTFKYISRRHILKNLQNEE